MSFIRVYLDMRSSDFSFKELTGRSDFFQGAHSQGEVTSLSGSSQGEVGKPLGEVNGD